MKGGYLNIMNAIDKAIRMCDELHYLFYRDIDGNKVEEKFSSIGSMRKREEVLRAHEVNKMKEWTHAEWASKEDFNKIYNKMKGSI